MHQSRRGDVEACKGVWSWLRGMEIGRIEPGTIDVGSIKVGTIFPAASRAFDRLQSFLPRPEKAGSSGGLRGSGGGRRLRKQQARSFVGGRRFWRRSKAMEEVEGYGGGRRLWRRSKA